MEVNNFGRDNNTSLNYNSNTINILENNHLSNEEPIASGIERELINAIENASHVKKGTTECQFSVHEKTKQILIKLVDTTTKEVIKELPPEKILDAVASLCETAGLFVDEKG